MRAKSYSQAVASGLLQGLWRHQTPSRLSVRRSMQLAMLLLTALAVFQVGVVRHVSGASAFMLQRAEMSYRQLDGYRQLSIDLLEYIGAVDRFGRTGDAAARRERIVRDRIHMIDRLAGSEIDIIRRNGGDETNVVERRRLGDIQGVIERILAPASSATEVVALYRDTLKPMMTKAVDGEEAETVEVEAAMDEMQDRVRWLGTLAALAEVVTVIVVLGVVTRAVLNPLGRLVADIREYGRGRLGHRVAVLRHDEFGLLAQHVNRMARHLDRRTRALVAMNAGLEATVDERTRALIARNEELREIDESRRRFFVDVSHELRTPLTAIVGEADVTLRSPTAEVATCREALASILANSTYLNRRIDDLMALARSSNGQLELERQVLDLNLVATEAMAEVRSLAKVNQVMSRFVPLTHPVNVDGDKVRLRQCLMILLDNAVKFSRAYQAIEIRLEAREDFAELTVIDEGRGIPAHDLPSIFERFYQTEIGRRMGGTGIGLAIARRIVESHGGTISAAQGVGGGTAVTLTLPLAKGLG